MFAKSADSCGDDLFHQEKSSGMLLEMHSLQREEVEVDDDGRCSCPTNRHDQSLTLATWLLFFNHDDNHKEVIETTVLLFLKHDIMRPLNAALTDVDR